MNKGQHLLLCLMVVVGILMLQIPHKGFFTVVDDTILFHAKINLLPHIAFITYFVIAMRKVTNALCFKLFHTLTKYLSCGALNKKCLLHLLGFEYLVPSCWGCWERLRWQRFSVRSMSLGILGVLSFVPNLFYPLCFPV